MACGSVEFSCAVIFEIYVPVCIKPVLKLLTVMWCIEAAPFFEVEFSLSLPLSWPRSRLICLGLATALRHQS